MTEPTEAEVEAAAAKARAIWFAMSEDERRDFLRGKLVENPVPVDCQDMAEAFIEYAATVSPDWMAMSFAAAVFLARLCEDHHPEMVADFGSGFSSYVLRRYAARSGAQVLSIDDSAEWLGKTRTFLKSLELSDKGLLTWDAWLERRRGFPLFDVAFHDLASGDLRESAMPIIADRMRVGGHLIFDDAQHGGHFEAMSAVAASHGWALACLPETQDGNGRFDAMCVCRAMSAA